MAAASLAELRDVAIAHEPDRYFSATLAPKTLRYDLIVLAAFAAELARIPGQVREPLAGEIRLQWWRDALADDGGDAAAGHPVATAMRATMARFALPRDIVEAVIDAQADVLHGEQPADEAALKVRLAAGEGGLFRLAARICANGEADELSPIADAAGLAYGLSRALARIPVDGAAEAPIPLSLIPAAGIDLAAHDDPALRSALGALAAMARRAHAEATAALAPISRRRRIAFLPLAMVKPNLGALETWWSRSGARAAEPLPIGRLLRLGWAHASGRL